MKFLINIINKNIVRFIYSMLVCSTTAIWRLTIRYRSAIRSGVGLESRISDSEFQGTANWQIISVHPPMTTHRALVAVRKAEMEETGLEKIVAGRWEELDDCRSSRQMTR